MGWKPIETAPKDGTWIMGCVPAPTSYHDEKYAGYGSLPEAIHWGTYHPNSKGREEWRNQEGHKRPYCTHWDYLPEAPK